MPSSVSRRLATEKSKQVTVGSANKLVARYHSSGGVCTKCGHVTTNTHATSDTHRGGISSRPRSDVPSDDTSSKVRGQDIDTYVSADHDSLFFPVAPRTPELSNRCNLTRQVASQTSAAVFAKSLGTGLKGPQGPDPSEARSVGPSPSVVVGQEVHQSRNATGHSRGSDASLYRCVGVRLGSPFGQTPGEWELVDEGGHSAHQLPRDVGGAVRPVRAFWVQLKGLTVQLMSDNASVVSYIPKQGGTVSVPLYRLTREVLILARDAQITLLAKHIPGERNALADLLSRMDKIVHTEWTLLHSVFKALCMVWDTPNLDLFATRLNNRLPVFVSPMADPLAMDVDAMSWRGMYAHAFPPFVMLGRVLEKVISLGTPDCWNF